jgi:hypothetical protein
MQHFFRLGNSILINWLNPEIGDIYREQTEVFYYPWGIDILPTLNLAPLIYFDQLLA